MKKVAKLLCLISAVVCLAFALTACGGKSGDKYAYSDTKVSVTGNMPGLSGAFSGMESAFDNAYKDSEIVVSDSEIEWSFAGQTSTMTIESKDGKDVLGGEMTERLTQMFASIGSGNSIAYYGEKTESGYSIILEQIVGAGEYSSTVTTIINFAK